MLPELWSTGTVIDVAVLTNARADFEVEMMPVADPINCVETDVGVDVSANVVAALLTDIECTMSASSDG